MSNQDWWLDYVLDYDQRQTAATMYSDSIRGSAYGYEQDQNITVKICVCEGQDQGQALGTDLKVANTVTVGGLDGICNGTEIKNGEHHIRHGVHVVRKRVKNGELAPFQNL